MSYLDGLDSKPRAHSPLRVALQKIFFGPSESLIFHFHFLSTRWRSLRLRVRSSERFMLFPTKLPICCAINSLLIRGGQTKHLARQFFIDSNHFVQRYSQPNISHRVFRKNADPNSFSPLMQRKRHANCDSAANSILSSCFLVLFMFGT